MTSPSGVVQSGSWWPHQSWRDRHQSGVCSSEVIANRCCDSGWKRTRRSRSASIAGFTGSSILHHHCSEISGSMREWHRSHVPTAWRWFSRFDELPALLDPGEHCRICLGLRQPCEITGLVVHPAVGADHHRLGKPVVAADLEVQGVVARRDLERTRPEVGLDARVRDHRHPALHVRDDDLTADRPAVALVVRVNGDGDIAENRRESHRCDHDSRPPRRLRRRMDSGRTRGRRPSPRARPRDRRSRSGGKGTS